MGRNLSPVLRRELENLDKDADSRRSAMKALKSYVKDLDSKAIPLFLAQVSETKEPGSSSGEYTISLYEVLARVHGRNIVPQIDNIMSTIIRTLSSSAGSFPLHQACSKVVPAVARYGIDPSTPENEKMRIICSLCKPLSNVLMGSQETVASGAALCLKALVESDNWRFASNDMVNEICLKVAGALEEKLTQTNSHMGLAMALSKHNSSTVEAYARSLIRSGLQILTVGATESNSQKRFSAIQMLNFFMKCVDWRSISSELAKVVDVMENCQTDRMPFVRGAAFEALQTAKKIAAQEGSRHEVSSTPTMDSDFNKRSFWAARDNEGSGSHSPARFPSPESQTVDSFVQYDTFLDSPMSIGQSSCNIGYSRPTSRRLWNNDTTGVEISLEDGLLFKTSSGGDGSKVYLDQSRNGELSDSLAEHSETFSGFQGSASNMVMRDTSPSPQRSRPQLTIDDIKMYPTPRKLIRSLQNPTDAASRVPEKQCARVLQSPTTGELNWNKKMAPNEDSHSYNLNCEVDGRRNVESMRILNKHNNIQDPELVPDSAESVSSTGDVPADTACKVLCNGSCGGKNGVQILSVERRRHGKAALNLVCGFAIVFLAIILSTMLTDYDENCFDVVPT